MKHSQIFWQVPYFSLSAIALSQLDVKLSCHHPLVKKGWTLSNAADVYAGE